MYYLLGTQVIVDIARGLENGAAAWLRRKDREISAQNIKVSAMSWAAIEIEFRNISKQLGVLTRNQTVLKQRIQRVFEKYRALKSVLPVSDEAIRIWVDYLQEDVEYLDEDRIPRLVGLEEKMVLATAMAGFQDTQLTLVAKKETVHGNLHILGLRVEDPYN